MYLQDAVLILDQHNKIVQHNNITSSFFGSDQINEIQSSLDSLLNNVTFFEDELTLDSILNDKYISLSLAKIKIDQPGFDKILIIKDFTARKLSEDQLRESEERFQHLADATFEGIAIIKDKQIVDLNSQFADLLGFDLLDMKDTPYVDLVFEADKSAVENAMDGSLDVVFEYRLVHKSGSVIPVEVCSKVIFYKDIPVQIMAVRDISHHKKVEASLNAAKVVAEDANRSKSEFLANMSHELRTPLNTIIGFSEVLKMGVFGKMNEKQEQYVFDVWKSGKHLLSLINDILDLSKIESGKMVLYKTEFNIITLLTNLQEEFLEKSRDFGHQIDLYCDDNLPMIFADERLIKQTLYNILSNAIKFTPDNGKIEIRSSYNESLKDLNISISDTGIGISESDRSKVFSHFEQIDSKYARQYDGTGLGMPLSKKFIELHDGEISFESVPDKGTTFNFKIPVNSNDA